MFIDKNVIITGATEGIGLGIARAFAQQRANLVLIARDHQKLNNIKEEFSSNHVTVSLISADLTETEKLPSVGKLILEKVKTVDVLINNAGIGRFNPFEETSEDLLDKHINLNMKAPYMLTQNLYQSLKKSKGNIINISSYFSHRMLPGRESTAYSMTKGGIDSFTKSLAFEAGKDGIRVNAIAPGSIDTPLLRYNLEQLSEEGKTNFHTMIKSIYPMGSIGTVDDIGAAAVFLASNQAQWITGTILSVDGGLTTN